MMYHVTSHTHQTHAVSLLKEKKGKKDMSELLKESKHLLAVKRNKGICPVQPKKYLYYILSVKFAIINQSLAKLMKWVAS